MKKIGIIKTGNKLMESKLVQKINNAKCWYFKMANKIDICALWTLLLPKLTFW